MELKERIKMIIDLSGYDISKFSSFIGLKSPQAIRELLNGRTKTVSENVEAKILKAFPNINRDWLLYGEGEMLNPDADERPSSAKDDYIPLLPVEVIAGFPGTFIEGVNMFDCRKVSSPFPGAEYAIEVSGDSMTPDIKSGDRLYIRKINERAFIPYGHIVVLDTENGAVVKRIQPCEDTDYIMAVSTNPQYPPYKIENRSIYGVYKILGTITINSTL